MHIIIVQSEFAVYIISFFVFYNEILLIVLIVSTHLALFCLLIIIFGLFKRNVVSFYFEIVTKFIYFCGLIFKNKILFYLLNFHFFCMEIIACKFDGLLKKFYSGDFFVLLKSLESVFFILVCVQLDFFRFFYCSVFFSNVYYLLIVII